MQAFRLAPAGRPVRILDLGANVGYFSLRCAALHCQARPGAPLEIFAVEGSSRLFGELQERAARSAPSGVTLTLKHGLVGRRSGKAMFHSSLFSSCTNAVSRDANVSSNPLRNNYAEECEYLDLDTVIAPGTELDLIKCDIEGSELEFLQAYPDLLGRARSLVVELHPLECDTPTCRDLLKTYGFARQRVIKELPTHSQEMYIR